MYYVPDGTQRCGFYECKECGNRFLDVRIAPAIICPYCGEEPDMELGPDDEMQEANESAKLSSQVLDLTERAFVAGELVEDLPNTTRGHFKRGVE